MGNTSTAIVRPRVRSPFSGEVVVLEDLVLDLLAEERRELLHVSGPPGSGLGTTRVAMEAVFARDERVRLETGPRPSLDQPMGALVLWIPPRETHPVPRRALAVSLTPWTMDEALEYLQARHPQACAGVMRRLGASRDTDLLEGCPELWALVLDELAASPSLAGAAEALRRHVSSWELHEATPEALTGLWLATGPDFDYAEVLRDSFPGRSFPRRQAMRAWFALQTATAIESGNFEILSHAAVPEPKALRLIEHFVGTEGRAAEHMRLLLRRPELCAGAFAASLLMPRDAAWVRLHLTTCGRSRRLPSLARAQLPELDAHALTLSDLMVAHANLRRADFRSARLPNLQAQHADLTRADLSDAELEGAHARRIVLRRARLAGACLDRSLLGHADLYGAVLDAASLIEVALDGADLRCASLRCIQAQRALFAGARLEGADLTGADLTGALLHGVDLRQTCLTHATLAGAGLSEANLAHMDLSGLNMREADLKFAGLTGTRLAGAQLPQADLTGARMAHVNLETANLHGANLRQVNFHMGSSRSGLVDSPIASEGSRMGFYTEDDATYDFKRPEEIRKANLRGADLLGAYVEDTDFYLVDVRDVLCTEAQREHFRRCRAILE